ncbi:MAG: fumarylacetoacetate hydrolase family protein [Burkholderiales bacterium]|nr:fumarylacetoacetate hydrolase family protein [Burkholderiales bacterium]
MTLPLVIDQALARLRGVPLPVDRAPHTLALDALDTRPPVDGQVIGTLVNFREVLDALGDAVHTPPLKAPPVAPVLYVQPRNTHVAHGAEFVLPAGVDALEIGASIGLVIARTACALAPEDALAAVAGCTIVVDASAPHAPWFRPSTRQKAFDGSCAIGPWVVARRHLPDLATLELTVRVDDVEVQRASLASLIRPVPRLLADITAFMTLAAGDVVTVGVPQGAPLVHAGQQVDIEVAGIGSMRHRVVQATDRG